jgi:cytochrome c-type biogenesis protein CcmE
MNETELVRRKSRRFMVGAFSVAAVAFGVIAWSGINKNLVYYWTPTELLENGDKAYGATIRLGGMVAPHSIQKLGGSGVQFVVHDGPGRITVKTSSVPPQMFRENIGVVVEGTMVKGGYFQSSRLMVSHNNEYKAPDQAHPVDQKTLKKMIETAEATEGN